MQVHRTLAQMPDFRRPVVTIGSFDGIHGGHVRLLERVRQLAKDVDGEQVVLTFHPHPRLVLHPQEHSLRLLNSPDEKIALLAEFGVDHLVMIPFDADFAAMSAQEYIEDFLLRYFHPSYVVVGYDHRFGAGRTGNISLLREYESKGAFKVLEISRYEEEDLAVSSTRIRNALKDGDVVLAAQCLGRCYRLQGTVVHGQAIGRTLGFPTANIQPDDPYKMIPALGIYAVWVTVRSQRFGGMLYIGHRPTLPERPELVIEVNIFDFNQYIYGEAITVDFVERLRGDATFDGLAALKTQLAADSIHANEVLQKKASRHV